MTVENMEKLSAGRAARVAANKRFFEQFKDEFEKILAEERKARGLFPKVNRRTLKQVTEELNTTRQEFYSFLISQGMSEEEAAARAGYQPL